MSDLLLLEWSFLFLLFCGFGLRVHKPLEVRSVYLPRLRTTFNFLSINTLTKIREKPWPAETTIGTLSKGNEVLYYIPFQLIDNCPINWPASCWSNNRWEWKNTRQTFTFHQTFHKIEWTYQQNQDFFVIALLSEIKKPIRKVKFCCWWKAPSIL